MQWFVDFLGEIAAFDLAAVDPRIQAPVAVLVSVIAAKLFDWIITRLLLRRAPNTEGDFYKPPGRNPPQARFPTRVAWRLRRGGKSPGA